MDKPKNDTEALALALMLAVTAPDDDKMHRAIGLADKIAAGMPELEVARAKKLAEKLIDETPTASDTFAERVRAARLAAGLTQQQLCDRLKDEAAVRLDTSAITRIESGRRDPRLSEALAIAAVLGL